ncbi:MAG: hypothetical protein ACYTAN_03965 [Planctomycetota bacterium]|jgi:hypothetical protein
MFKRRLVNGVGVLVFLCLLAGLQTACGTKPFRAIGRQKAPTEGKISEEELRGRLMDFAEFSRGRINQAGAELERKIQTSRAEKTAVQMRARSHQAVLAMLNQSDAIASFVELWGLAARLRIFFEEGEGSKFFGEYQYIVVEAMHDIEGEIEGIGAEFLDEDLLEVTRGNIKEFARANPVTGLFSNLVVFATEVRPGKPNPFVSVLNVPMAPFRALEGVPRTATAISDFTATAERFAGVVSSLPESARWQLLLLLYDLEDTEMMESLLESTALLAESSTRFAEVAENLPEQLREELSILVEQMDAKQEGLQGTLAQAETTTAAVERALEKVGEAAVSLETAAKGVTETARAVQSAVEATGKTAVEVRDAFPPREETESSFEMEDLRGFAEEVTRAAVELRALTAELRDLTEARNLSSLTGHITRRAVEIILLIFVLALLYRLAATRLLPRPRAGGGKEPSSGDASPET